MVYSWSILRSSSLLHVYGGSLQIREADVAPAGPVRLAEADVSFLLKLEQCLDVLLGQIYDLGVFLDAMGRYGLGDDCAGAVSV